MRVALLSLLLAGAGLSSATATEGLPTDDPTLRPYQETTTTYIGRCRGNLSHVEESNCLFDQAKALRIRLRAEVKKHVADAEATAAEGPIGGISGAERASIEKKAVLRGQAAWEAYTKAICDEAFAQVERGGGNGGDLEAANCQIRHLVNRYNELRR